MTRTVQCTALHRISISTNRVWNIHPVRHLFSSIAGEQKDSEMFVTDQRMYEPVIDDDDDAGDDTDARIVKTKVQWCQLVIFCHARLTYISHF